MRAFLSNLLSVFSAPSDRWCLLRLRLLGRDVISRFISVVVLACFCVFASAQVTSAGPTIAAVSNGFHVGYASNGVGIATAARTYGAGVSAGEALVMDMFSTSIAPGVTGEFVATRVVTAAAVAEAMGAIAAVNAPIAAAGFLALGVWQAAGCKAVEYHIECDFGAQSEKVAGTCYSAAGSECLGSLTAARQYYLDVNLGAGYTLSSCTTVQQTATFDYSSCVISKGEWTGHSAITVGIGPGAEVDQCPIDAFTGVRPAVRADGRCPSGVYTPAWQADVTAQIKAMQAVKPANIVETVDATVKAGGSIQPKEANPKVSGPASLPGPTKTETVTKPDGTTQTKVSTPTYTLTYTNNQVKVGTSTSESTTTVGPGGETSTETKTTEGEDKPTDVDICKLNPDILACIKPGDVEDGPDIPTRDIPVSVVDRVFGPSSGSCPAGNYTIGGKQFTGFFDILCDWLSGLRFVILGVCGFVAARILAGMTSKD